jgi:hypothetical protein
MFGLGTPEIILLSIIALLIPLITLIDILRNEFTGNNKIIWIIIVILFPCLGFLLYIFIGRNHKIKVK